MSRTLRPADSLKPSPGLVRSLVWLARGLLVVLLVADLVGSPLHRHRHNTGIDASSMHGQLADSTHSAHHVDEDEHAPDFVHAVTTVRAESRAQTPDAYVDGDLQDAALASAWVIPVRGSPVTARLSWNQADTALHRLHRSLPPAGRAPPLRA